MFFLRFNRIQNIPTQSNFSLQKKKKIPTKALQTLLYVILIFGYSSYSLAKEYSFIVQPVMSPEKTKALYQPLVDYISKETGHTFKLVAEKNFLSYWFKMKKGKYDLIMDAAHFTDYRVNNLDYSILAKVPDTVSFSLITNGKDLVFDHKELIGKKLITLPPPSMGAVRLLQMYTNPLRQPNIISAVSANQAITGVQNRKYFAALVPTPMLNNISDINIITTTEPVPHTAISASKNINKELQEKIRHVLIKASDTEAGKKLLQKLNITSFTPTTEKTYHGYEKYLAGILGYQGK